MPTKQTKYSDALRTTKKNNFNYFNNNNIFSFVFLMNERANFNRPMSCSYNYLLDMFAIRTNGFIPEFVNGCWIAWRLHSICCTCTRHAHTPTRCPKKTTNFCVIFSFICIYAHIRSRAKIFLCTISVFGVFLFIFFFYGFWNWPIYLFILYSFKFFVFEINFDFYDFSKDTFSFQFVEKIRKTNVYTEKRAGACCKSFSPNERRKLCFTVNVFDRLKAISV